MKIIEIPIKNIIIQDRIRDTLGDVKGLAKNIEIIGLLNPITVRQNDQNFFLLAGWRRLEACKILKHKTIQAKIINEDPIFYDSLDVYDFERACHICDYPLTNEHHIFPKNYDGLDTPANKIFLCPNHHRIIDYLTQPFLADQFKEMKEAWSKNDQNCKRYLEFSKKITSFDPEALKYFDIYIEPFLKKHFKAYCKQTHELIERIKNES